MFLNGRRSKTVCFCGHEENRLPRGGELSVLEKKIFSEVDRAVNDGFEDFLFVGSSGFSIIAAKQVLLRKRLQKGNVPDRIRLTAVMPYEEHAVSWGEKEREEYYDILSQCDECVCVHARRTENFREDCDKLMIDKSSRMICRYDGGEGETGYAVFYAGAKYLDIVNLYSFGD